MKNSKTTIEKKMKLMGVEPGAPLSEPQDISTIPNTQLLSASNISNTYDWYLLKAIIQNFNLSIVTVRKCVKTSNFC